MKKKLCQFLAFIKAIPGIIRELRQDFKEARKERGKGFMPFTVELLRAPGERLRRRAMSPLHFGIASGLFLLGAILGSALYQWGGAAATMAVLTPLSLLFFFVAAPIVDFRSKKFYRGYLGERRVAQTLEQLGRRLWRVYHGVRGKYGDIDHVLVCHKGVFCVETKTIRRFRTGEKLIYTAGPRGGVMSFSGGAPFPRDPLWQPRKNAHWLQGELKEHLQSRNLPGPGYVRRIIVFPEWRVEGNDKGENEFPCNPDEVEGFILAPESKGRLSRAQIREIHKFLSGKIREEVSDSI